MIFRMLRCLTEKTTTTPARFAVSPAAKGNGLEKEELEQKATEGTERLMEALCSLCCLLFISSSSDLPGPRFAATATANSDDRRASWQPQSRRWRPSVAP